MTIGLSNIKDQIVHLQVTREDYFEAALAILAADGHHALKMTPLCKGLGVTTGSFYNYFGSWAEFTAALLGYWESEQARRLAELGSVDVGHAELSQTLAHVSCALTHGAEVAIRAWSNGDPVIADFQDRVDSLRFDAVRAVFAALVADDDRVELLTVASVCMLIGIQQLGFTVDLAATGTTAETGLGDHTDVALFEALAGVLSSAPHRPDSGPVAGSRAAVAGRSRRWHARTPVTRAG